ncbi:MAG: hypothetical protein IPL33_03840 [Sphingobacteriales bacterium]|nr:hypothetical protein [Sphingobacteriales bacterium]
MLKYLSTFMLLLSLVWFDLNAQDTPAADCWTGRLFVKIKDNVYVTLPDYDRQKNAGKVVQYPVLGPLLEQFEVEKITHAFPLLRSTTFDNTYEVHFDPAKSTDEFVRFLAANPTVEYAEKVPIDRLCYDPNDPKEGDGTQWSLNTIQAQAAWDINVGSSAVTVALLMMPY